MTDSDKPNPWAEIVGSCFTATSLARTLGWEESDVADAATSLTVLELRTSDDVLLYPAFQVSDGHLVAGLGDVLQVLSTGTKGRWTWAQWLNTSVDDESGEVAPSAIERLLSGQLDEVLRDARHTAWAWSS
ncbi:hypothetical protein [Microbacterium oxydans]|uniref:Uncharacterized protein n=1 Tax=Microbacterium oxydans TaxID=82380 RepID=A0A0F0L956_9MICO|nr:hypothetical protein [Microbacterium oxydans]KJL28820.1 hypothetical protein RS83_02301 [Microbacterium oxydans]